MNRQEVLTFLSNVKKENKLKLKTIHEETGISQSTLSSYFYNQKCPRLDVFLYLVDYLGYEVKFEKKNNH